MNIVLIGFMCSGKSRVGQLLSKKLGWVHVDTDAVVAQQAGMTVANIIRERGENVFRNLEHQVIGDLVSRDNVVISTGGGVPLNPENMKILAKHGQVVWLKVSPEIVLKRVRDVSARPLIDPSRPLESVRERLQSREAVYAQAPFSIDTDNSSPEAVAEKILTLFPTLKT